MYECEWIRGTLIKCDDYATIEVKGNLYRRYLCSLHASELARSLGAEPSEVENMRVYA